MGVGRLEVGWYVYRHQNHLYIQAIDSTAGGGEDFDGQTYF
jgi:hypothetical protein